jgi:hypothetical protein
MIMKATTLAVLALLGLAGAACSQPATEATDSVPAEIASADDGSGSKLNLNLQTTDTEASSSGLNLGTPSLDDGGLLIGEDALKEPDLGGEINVDVPETITETDGGEDDVVRLTPGQ